MTGVVTALALHVSSAIFFFESSVVSLCHVRRLQRDQCTFYSQTEDFGSTAQVQVASEGLPERRKSEPSPDKHALKCNCRGAG